MLNKGFQDTTGKEKPCTTSTFLLGGGGAAAAAAAAPLLGTVPETVVSLQ